MKTRAILFAFLGIMAALILAAIIFPSQLLRLLDQPALYPHALFVHVVASTLFFGNAVVGILWEARALASGHAAAILHTYRTVAWLDARLSSPLIVISLIGGIMLSVIIGDLWQIGWLSLSFLLFVFSGLVWVASDIPTQSRIRRLMAHVAPEAETIPENLMRLLRMRLWISIAGVLPLVVVFVLMIYKPDILPVAAWFGGPG